MHQRATVRQYDLFSAKENLPVPRLVVDWTPFWSQLLQNISDLFRKELPMLSSSRPGVFWPDVFVNRPIPWKDFGRSVFFHASLVLFFFMTGRYWFFPSHVSVRAPFDSTTLTYYKVDDVLPQVKSAPAIHPRAVKPMKGQPELAKQEVISVPVRADNSEQTIVNPPHPDIIRDTQPLPNLVVSTLTPAPPSAALAGNHVTLPQFLIKPVQPAPEVTRAKQAALPKVAVPEAIQPVESTDDLRVKNEIKSLVAKMEPKVDAPKLPEPEPAAANSAAPPEPIPAQPSTQGVTHNQKSAGQLMVLNVRPVAPPAEIKIPNGSRAGVFAATPSGKIGAPGTPDIQAAPADENAVGTNGAAANASGNGKVAAMPAGVSVSGVPLNARAGAVVAAPAVLPPKPVETHPLSTAPSRTFAMASPDIRRTPPYISNPERRPEDTVFNGKKYYSMQLNMPNLVSAGGSWIIRFAELKDDTGDGELSTPVVTEKIDPAYPADLMRAQVEGTVILYAVIRADGTVGDVRVLEGLQASLDANACRALGRWHFRPATKNGVPVDLEAVVRIPFKARKIGF
jgi:TonB family protein